MGYRLALPLASLVFLGAFIPLVGAVVAGFLAVVVALIAKGWIFALITLGLIIAVQQLEGHVLQPLVMGRAVSVHPLAIVLAIAGGAVMAGIVGALLAVPVVAFINSAMRVLLAREPAAEEAAQEAEEGPFVKAEADDVEAHAEKSSSPTRAGPRGAASPERSSPRRGAWAPLHWWRFFPWRPNPFAAVWEWPSSRRHSAVADVASGSPSLARCQGPDVAASAVHQLVRASRGSRRLTVVSPGAAWADHRQVRCRAIRRARTRFPVPREAPAGPAERCGCTRGVRWVAAAALLTALRTAFLAIDIRVVGGSSSGGLPALGIRVVPAPEGAAFARGVAMRVVAPGRDGPSAAGCVGSCGGRGRGGAGAPAPTRASSGSRTAGRLRSSGSSVSPRPSRSCSRFIHRGAHQQSSPSSFMIAGTRNIRTTVASSSSAMSRPKARYFIITRSENTNAPATTARTKGGAGDQPAGGGGADADGLGGGHAAFAGLDHAGDQEHLVVGRQTPDDGDDQTDHRRHQRLRRVVHQSGAVTFDEHPRQNAHRRAEGQRAHHRRLDGQHHRAEREEHQDGGRHNQDGHHQRQLVEQTVNTVLLQSRCAADQYRRRRAEER